MKYRRLPVYLVLDCSESMADDPLALVEAGVKGLVNRLKKEPHSLETVWLSVIAFAAKAKKLVPLTDLSSFVPPALSLRPGTAMGAALDLLRESIQAEVRMPCPEVKGDYMPYVFILTDGRPTDDLAGPLRLFKVADLRLSGVYGFGIGRDADFASLAKISDVVFKAESMSPNGFCLAFGDLIMGHFNDRIEWPVCADPRDYWEYLTEDSGIKLIDPNHPFSSKKSESRLFLHAVCSKSRKKYLMIYRWSPEISLYSAEESLPLPDDFFADGAGGPGASTDLELLTSARCPYCHNSSWVVCDACGRVTCLDYEKMPPRVTCPSCEKAFGINLNYGYLCAGPITGSAG
jgi:uncharacterized protein YegL